MNKPELCDNAAALIAKLMDGKTVDKTTVSQLPSIATRAIVQLNRSLPPEPVAVAAAAVPPSPVLERILEQGQQTLSALSNVQGQVVTQQDQLTNVQGQVVVLQHEQQRQATEQQRQATAQEQLALEQQRQAAEQQEFRGNVEYRFSRMNRTLRSVQHEQMRVNHIMQHGPESPGHGQDEAQHQDDAWYDARSSD